MERSRGLQMVWLRVWLYVLPCLFILLASAIYIIAPQGDPLAHLFAIGMAVVCVPLQLLNGRRLEKRLGLGALPDRRGIAFFLLIIGLTVLVEFVVGWKAKNQLGFPLVLIFLSSTPSWVATFKSVKASQLD